MRLFAAATLILALLTLGASGAGPAEPETPEADASPDTELVEGTSERAEVPADKEEGTENEPQTWEQEDIEKDDLKECP